MLTNPYQILIILNSIIFIKSSLIFPFKTITNISSENDYISKVYNKDIYSNIFIGSNKEQVKAIIKMDEVGIFVYQNAYDYNKSSSFSNEEVLKTFVKFNYQVGYYSNDTFYFNNEKNNIDTFNNITFALVIDNQKDFYKKTNEKYCFIGLRQTEYTDQWIIPLFIENLKKMNYINSYTYSLKYDKNSNNEGQLIIGEELSDEKLEKMINVNSGPLSGQTFWNLNFKNVSINFFNETESYSKEFSLKLAEPIGNLPYIIGNTEYKTSIYYHFFQNLFLKDICILKNITINVQDDFSIYLCDGESNEFKEAYKNSFPNLTFFHRDFNKSFILTKEDLFTKNIENQTDKNIYFLVIFSNLKDDFNPYNPSKNTIQRWKLGIPFFKKYQLYFNSDSKTISYIYEEDEKISDEEKKENNETHNKGSIILLIVLIVIFTIVVFVLGMLFHKNIIKLPRKKKANELDDEFEYKSMKKDVEKEKEKAILNNYSINE